MTVTDELLAELEEAASNATPGPWSYDGSYVCTMRQDGETVYVESWNPVADALLSKNVKYISAANPSTITALTAELRRLRAENAELAQSLAESRANDQAAMGWLTSLRWASGDCGERMLPELVTHIEGLAKDSARLEWMVTEGAVIARMSGTGRPTCYQVSFPFEGCQQLDWFQSWREAVDAIMAAQ